MKPIKIRRRDNGEIWAIDIFDFFIDFRKWYKVYIPEEDRSPINTVDKNGWSDIWFEEWEVIEMKGDDESFRYKLVNPLIANLHLNDIYYKLRKPIWFSIGAITMYLFLKIKGML